MLLDTKMYSFLNVEVQGRILIDSAESVSSPNDSSMLEKHMVRTNAALTTDTSVQIHESSESSVLSLHSRAANFVRTGTLDIFKGRCLIHQYNFLLLIIICWLYIMMF